MGAIDDLIARLQKSSYYDKSLAAATNAAQRRAADLQAQYTVGKQNIMGQYDADSYDINKALDQALHNLSGNYGDRGTIHSSVYVDDQGRTNNAAQDQLSKAALRRTQGLAGLESGLQSGQTELLNLLGGEEANAASRAAAARHQAQLEFQEQIFRAQQLGLQRQGIESQKSYYQQSMAAQQQAAAQQQQQYAALTAAMKPIQYPTGQYAYPQQVSQPQQPQQPSGGGRGWVDWATGGAAGRIQDDFRERLKNPSHTYQGGELKPPGGGINWNNPFQPSYNQG